MITSFIITQSLYEAIIEKRYNDCYDITIYIINRGIEFIIEVNIILENSYLEHNRHWNNSLDHSARLLDLYYDLMLCIQRKHRLIFNQIV